MISKKLFVEAIEAIKKLRTYQEERNKLAQKYGADGFIIEPTNETIILKIIRESIGKCENIDALETFCYQNNFGKGKGNQIFVDVDGHKHTITSAGELYDYLLSEIGGD